MHHLAPVLALTVGGVLGVNARYWLSILLGRWFGTNFPWATILVNVSGSFAMGLAAVAVAERWTHPLIRIGAISGFLGGYTTFSAYMLESLTLWDRGDRTLAAGNVAGSVLAGLMAVALGFALGRWLFIPTPHAPLAEVILEQRVESIGEAVAGRALEPESSQDPAA